MLKFFFLFATISVLLLATACFGTLNPDNENPCLPEDLQTLYQNDAVRLALRLQQNSNFADDIQIPEAWIERMNIALAALHQSDGSERDSVITRYQIHTLPYPMFDELTVEIDTNQAWTQAWRSNNRLTSNTQINDLMLAYNLQLDGFFSLSNNFAILTTTDHYPLNIAALATAFEAIPGVLSTDYQDTGGGGNDITAQDAGTYIQINYIVGYDEIAAPDNCNGDCEFSRTWTFHANFPNNNTDCPTVEFINSYGDPAP